VRAVPVPIPCSRPIFTKPNLRRRSARAGCALTLVIRALAYGVLLDPGKRRVAPLRAIGALSVIEMAIQRQGGNTRPETLEERAERLNRQNIAQRERIAFLSSPQAVNAAVLGGRELIKAVAERAAQLPGWGLKVETYVEANKVDNFAEVVAPQRVLKVTWHKPYSNNMNEAELRVEVWKGPPPRPGRSYFRGEEPPCERRERFSFDRTLGGSDVWTSNGKHLTQMGMVDHALRMLLDAIHKAEMDQKPR
jgi:hypothetical protein